MIPLRTYILGAVVLTVIGYITYLNGRNNSLERDLAVAEARVAEKQAYITAQNIAIEANKADYELKLSKLPTVIKEINTVYKTKYETIYQWEESNASSDCNSSIQYLNSFQF